MNVRRSLPAFLLVPFALAPLLAFSASDPVNPPAGVAFEQRIGEKLPLALTFTDTSGASRQLGEFFRAGQPVVLYFGYARCPQLCSVVADGTNNVLRRLEPSVGRDFQVVTLSIDPDESLSDAHATEALAVRRYGRTGAAGGWHYLTGNAHAIDALTAAAGFHYRYDPRSRQYAHASGFLIATPDGTIARYFFGVDFDAAQVATALNRAAHGRTGESVYELLLLCFHGGAIGGRYGVLIWRALEVGVGLTVIGLFGGVGWMLYQERRAFAAARKEAA